MIELCIEAHEEEPEEIVLDLDATDDRIHGNQVGRFFHGYYDHYCFLPLYIFAGDHLLCARLRTADQDGAAGPRRSPQKRPVAVTSKPASWEVAQGGVHHASEAVGCKPLRGLVRQLLGPHLSRWAWCIRRSSRALTAAVSPRSLPQSSTGRLEVRIVLARS